MIIVIMLPHLVGYCVLIHVNAKSDRQHDLARIHNKITITYHKGLHLSYIPL